MLVCLAVFALRLSGFALQAKPASEVLREANEAYRAMHSGEAVRLYKEYLKQDPRNASVRIFLGAALLNLNRLNDAKAEVKQVLAENTNLSKAYVLLARIDSAQGAWDVAQQSFARALSLDSRDRDALYFSGRAFYDANRFEPAIERFEAALALGATQSRTYENLALCYEALNERAKAETAFHSAIQVAGDEYRPYLSYGRFLFKEGRTEQGVDMLEKAFQRQPDATEVRFELARALYHANRVSDAARILNGALPSNQCRVHNLMAKILASEGEKEAVEREIRLMTACSSDEEAGQTVRGGP